MDARTLGTGASLVAEERARARSARRPAARRSPSPTSATATRSISPETIAALLGPEAAHAVAVLRRFRERGVRGLPIGPEPSAILANAVLSRLDDAIRTAAASGTSAGSMTSSLWGRPHDVRTRDGGRCARRGRRASAWISIATRRGSSRIETRPRRSCSATETPLSSRRREDPLPRIAGRDAFPSDDGGVDPRGRPARPARRHGRASRSRAHDRPPRDDDRPRVHRQPRPSHRDGPLARQRGRPGGRRPRRSFLALIRGRVPRTASPSCTSRGSTRPGGNATSSRPPHDLDAITSVPVVATRADGHISVVSSSTLAAIDLADADGVELDADGSPTGRLTKEANRRAVAWVEASYDTQRIEGFQLQAAGLAASRGVTSVHEMSLGRRRPRGAPRPSAPAAGRRRPDPRARCRSRRRWSGGSARSAATSRSTARSALGPRRCPTPTRTASDQGELYHDDDAMAEFFHAAHNAGLQVGVHAIGDRAIEQVLATWERVYLALDSRERRHFRARRHRIEHFVLPSATQIERTAMLGTRRVRAAGVRPALGAGRRDVRGAARPRPRDGRAPDPHDARTRDRGRRRLRLTGRAARPDARDRRARGAPRADAATHAARGAQAPPGRERSSRAAGREEGGAGARVARGLRRLRRRPAGASHPWRGSVRSSRSPSAARCSAPDRGARGWSCHCFSCLGLPSRPAVGNVLPCVAAPAEARSGAREAE